MMSTSQLWDEARGPDLSDGEDRSYPFPLKDSGKLRLGMFVYGTQVDAQYGLFVSPPHLLRLVDPRTGEIVSTKRVGPRDYGLSDDPSRRLGISRMPENMSPPQFVGSRQGLFAALDTLLPAYEAGASGPATPEVRKAAYAFKRIFPVVGEVLLLPYYRAAARDFFAWLDVVAPPGEAPPADSGPPRVDLVPDKP